MTAPVVVIGTNSWAALTWADDYFAAKYGGDAWAALSALVKTQLLITACHWIRDQGSFDVSLTDTSDLVKRAQCEAAWFIYSYFEDYEKRRALVASGVRSFKMLDSNESLTDVEFPTFLSDMLQGYSTTFGGAMPRVSRALQDNVSE